MYFASQFYLNQNYIIAINLITEEFFNLDVKLLEIPIIQTYYRNLQSTETTHLQYLVIFNFLTVQFC